jgi:hypothetical protein
MKKELTPVLPESPKIADINDTIASVKTDLTSLSLNLTGQTTLTQLIKLTADKAASDVESLKSRLNAVESPSTNNASFILSGSPFVAAVAIGLRGLIHIRLDGKIEPADDTAPGKEANGIIDAPIAAGASGIVYGTGARFASVGLSGTQPGSQLFTGTAGLISLSSSGNGRFIQPVGIFKSSLYFFDFSDAGYWLEAL